MVQGYSYRGVNINTRDVEESGGEMHMKDYIDVSNQENVALILEAQWGGCIHAMFLI